MRRIPSPPHLQLVPSVVRPQPMLRGGRSLAVTGQIQFGTAAPNSFSRCRLRHVRRQREEQQRRPRPGPNLPNGIWNNFWTSAKRCEVTDGANETRMPRMTGRGCCVSEERVHRDQLELQVSNGSVVNSILCAVHENFLSTRDFNPQTQVDPTPTQ